MDVLQVVRIATQRAARSTRQADKLVVMRFWFRLLCKLPLYVQTAAFIGNLKVATPPSILSVHEVFDRRKRRH